MRSLNFFTLFYVYYLTLLIIVILMMVKIDMFVIHDLQEIS